MCFCRLAGGIRGYIGAYKFDLSPGVRRSSARDEYVIVFPPEIEYAMKAAYFIVEQVWLGGEGEGRGSLHEGIADIVRVVEYWRGRERGGTSMYLHIDDSVEEEKLRARKISQIKRARQGEKRDKSRRIGGLGGHAYETFSSLSTRESTIRGSFRNDYNDFHSKHLPIAYACSCGSS